MDNAAARPRLLVIDDSRMVRASIIRHVRESFQTREESDGESGWQTLLLDPTIQVVISDLSMPKLDGYALLERIRGSKIGRIRDIPVIMISGEEDEEARVRARNLGATDFVTKGTGTVELLTRLESAIKAAQVRRELEESREVLTRQKPVDPRLGIVSKEFLFSHGAQLLALAKRQASAVSVMVIDIDRYPELKSQHGPQVTALITRKLAKILAARVRKDDTVAQIDGHRFCIVSPSVNVDAYGAFALRLRSAIESIAMGYRGEIIRISLTIGLANSKNDAAGDIEELVRLAGERVVEGVISGGNRVVDARGEVTHVAFEAGMSLDRAVALIQQQSTDPVRDNLPGIVQRLLPLLNFLESEFRLGIPIAALEGRASDGAAREATTYKAER